MKVINTSIVILFTMIVKPNLFATARQLRGDRALDNEFDLSGTQLDPMVQLTIEHKSNLCATDNECKVYDGETCIDGRCIINLIKYVSYSSFNTGREKASASASASASESMSVSASATSSGNEETTSFNVDYVGVGSMTGLSFTVPAHSETRITANLQIQAMSSQNVKDLEAGWTALLSISKQEELREYKAQDTSLSANLSFMGFFSGGGKSTHTRSQSREYMESLGLTETQIDEAMSMFSDIAKEMSEVTYDSTIYNRNNPYPVSGMLQFFVMSGEVTSNSKTETWRTFSDGSVAGTQPQQAAGGGEFQFS